MVKKLFVAIVSLFLAVQAWGQTDTLWISDLYTTHVIFPTDVIYADLSNSQFVAVKIIEQNKNMIAMKARRAFNESCSVSSLESSGAMHTFIVKYLQNPAQLIVDMRENTVSKKEEQPSAGKGRNPSSASTWKEGNAPLLSEMYEVDRQLFHIGCKEYDIQFFCEDISSYSDITYVVLSLKNNSGISYTCQDATFVVESKRRTKRTVEYDNTIFPRSRYGRLSAAPGEYTRMVYSFDKLSLSKDQILKVYLYEDGGARNLVMTVDTKDVNKARLAR